MPRAVDFVLSCMNFDGGFGCAPGAESHGGQIFCCVGALAIAGALHHVRADELGWWLCERQLPGGGLNGRAPPPPPPSTNRTRLVPPPVLTGHVSSLLPY